MQTIGICDDEESTCRQLQAYLEQYLAQQRMAVEIKTFHTGEGLCRHIAANGSMAALFLDIELPKINGVMVGRYIREQLGNEETAILFISSKTQYAIELFQCRPLDFLVKPLKYEKIAHVMDILRKRGQLSGAYFSCKINGLDTKIPLQEIYYFRSENKKIHIVTKAGTEFFTGKLDQVASQVPQMLFLRIHKSYLVSYQHIAEFHYEHVKMANGDVLDISKAYRSQVRRQLLEYTAAEQGRGRL